MLIGRLSWKKAIEGVCMAAVSNPSLEKGEAALNQGNYNEAIAHLKGVCEVELDEMIVSRAQKALVVAYSKSEQIEQAIALCESLSLIDTEKVWTTKVLPDLYKRRIRKKTGIKGDKKNYRQGKTSSQIPVVVSSQESTPALVYTQRQWRNGERAKNWKPFKKTKMRQLWIGQLITVYGLFWLLGFLVKVFLTIINSSLVNLPLLEPIQLFYQDPSLIIIVFLIICLITSPWLLDFLLQQAYGLENLRLSKLASQHPETAKTLQKACRQRKLPLPSLGILPTKTPIILTYGNLPRTARIVVSQGLIEQLTDAELATIYATQIGYIIHRHFILMSSATTLLQIPYTLYWQIALVGEKFHQRLGEKSKQGKQGKNTRSNYQVFLSRGFNIQSILYLIQTKIPAVVLFTTTVLSALCYSLYWLLRLPILWLSRTRVYYGDRLAAEITGNPNALTRALLKISISTGYHIQQHQHTSWLLESFDLLTSVGHRQALSLGTLPDYTPLEEMMAWECVNPYRHWLKLTNSHPLMGERLYLLCRYAYVWKVQPELDLPTLAPPARTYQAKLKKALNSYRALPILQSAFLSGLLFGVMARSILWIIGIICDWLSDRVSLWWLIWLHNGESIPFICACILAAFSLSIIIWINGYFPDIKTSSLRQESRLPDLLANRDSLPPDGQGVRLTGKLLGRQGISNGLAQDLLLQTDTGTIKLHLYSRFGPLGNLFASKTNFQDCLNQTVTVKGWLRRGSTPWIDIDTMAIKDGSSIESGYPIWVTGLAITAAILATYLILQV